MTSSIEIAAILVAVGVVGLAAVAYWPRRGQSEGRALLFGAALALLAILTAKLIRGKTRS